MKWKRKRNTFGQGNSQRQHSIELIQKCGEYLPSPTSVCSEKTLTKKPIDHFGDAIIMTKCQGKKACFCDTGDNILSSSWYYKKLKNPADERLRIIKAAAAIIRHGIRSLVFDIGSYPAPKSAFDDVSAMTTDTLKMYKTQGRKYM